MRIIAGHNFEDLIDAVCVVCGRTWAELEHLTTDDVGRSDLAHTGTINAREIDEVIAERKRRADLRDAIWSAVEGISS